MSGLKFQFDSRRTAQATAFLLRRSGGKITKGHLVKMLYAADRIRLNQAGVPITGDQPASLPHGPVLSRTLNLLNGEKREAYWDTHISTAATDTHEVSLLADPGTDLLSENDQAALAETYDFFSKLTWDELKEYCHTKFPEWHDPKGSSKPIRFEEILHATGRTDAFIEDIKTHQAEEELFRRLG